MKDKEFILALSVMRELLWDNRSGRQKLQDLGVNLTPVNFYSNIPSIAEIVDSYEYREPTAPYLNGNIFNRDQLFKELSSLVEFSEDFNPAIEGDEENCRSFFWKNSQFSYSDCMSYYAYLRKLQPKKIVEIGSGFSSLIAVEAIEKNGFGQLTCIEPFPRSFITSLSNDGVLELLKIRAQNVSPEMLNSMMGDGDVLFVDSTHTVKTGSDCLHIYLRLLPLMRKKIYVHVHDIFLPFGLPQKWLLDKQIYWTEQYLLLAFMLDNPRIRVLFGSAYHQHFNAGLLDQFMHNRFIGGGSSFWFEYDGRE